MTYLLSGNVYYLWGSTKAGIPNPHVLTVTTTVWKWFAYVGKVKDKMNLVPRKLSYGSEGYRYRRIKMTTRSTSTYDDTKENTKAPPTPRIFIFSF